MESKSKKDVDEISMASATTASLHSGLDYDYSVALPAPARTNSAPSSSPSMEYKPTYTGGKEYQYNYYHYSGRDYPPSEPCEYDDPVTNDTGNTVDNKPSTLGSRLRQSMASISHCVQASGWALCCCGCLPCTAFCSACTGRRQSWG
ncbi:hypothetical protein TWF696_008071 [Orbilia brochopaga]|uniref:Uncharacterized protein n=1 Tax=Orbilia brochopaga TaxID=3140254 RepID=A0AAV9UMR9_9PEZI